MNSKCEKVLNVMSCLTGSDWGASRSAIKNIYIALIGSVLDYGCIAYGPAGKSSLKKRDGMQAQALRLCCGASCPGKRTGSVGVLCMEQ